MSEFSEAIKPWIDQDGLIGSCQNPTKWSSGNALLETAIACVMEKKLSSQNIDLEFILSFQKAIGRCQNLDGSFDKNPGRSDQITHDDLKGVAAVSRICGMPFAKDIVDFGMANKWFVFWNLTNTGRPYPEALARPWDKAFYKLCASVPLSLFEPSLLSASVIIDAKYGDPSSHRLTWLMSESIDLWGGVVKSSFDMWRSSMRKKYGTLGGINLEYYGASKINHPFITFGDQINF